MKKSKIFALIGVIASVILIIILITQNIRPYLDVSQVRENPSYYENKEIQVIGIVQGLTDNYFNLTNENSSLLVYTGDIEVPDEVQDGLQIVVTGIFNSTHVLGANQIITQCS